MITVICPVFNESAYIGKVLDFFIESEPSEKELIIVDGGSSDETKEIVFRYIVKYNNIKLIDNPQKYVPYALNNALLVSNGDPVIRLDAHTEYAPDYFTKIIETFNKSGADIVGGPMRARGKTTFQKAVAIATSTSFGVGDSQFHDEKFEGFTDSVYLGAWKRSVFKDVGNFDTDMLRNQDDEFHYRAAARGKKIYLNPEIKSVYFPRGDVRSLFRQYYQYGLFKPLVLQKVKAGIRIRHLIPCIFVMYLTIMILFLKHSIVLVPLTIYLLLSSLYATRYASGFKMGLSMFVVYPILHIAYGCGFINGLVALSSGKKPLL